MSSDVTAASWNARHFDPAAYGSSGNHTCLWDIARERLVADGYAKPTAQQIQAKVNEIVAFHNGQTDRPGFERIKDPDIIGDGQVIFMPADSTRVPAGTKLKVGDTVVSPDGRTVLTVANEKGDAAKLYVYRDDGEGFKKVGDFSLGSGVKEIEVTDDGTILIVDRYGKRFIYGAGHSQHARLEIQNDGNVVLYGAHNSVLWATNTQRR